MPSLKCYKPSTAEFCAKTCGFLPFSSATEFEKKREYTSIVPKHTCDLGCLYTSLFPILSYNPHQNPLKLHTHILLIHLGTLYRAESPVLPTVKVQDEGSSQPQRCGRGNVMVFLFFLLHSFLEGIQKPLGFLGGYLAKGCKAPCHRVKGVL